MVPSRYGLFLFILHFPLIKLIPLSPGLQQPPCRFSATSPPSLPLYLLSCTGCQGANLHSSIRLQGNMQHHNRFLFWRWQTAAMDAASLRCRRRTLRMMNVLCGALGGIHVNEKLNHMRQKLLNFLKATWHVPPPHVPIYRAFDIPYVLFTCLLKRPADNPVYSIHIL